LTIQAAPIDLQCIGVPARARCEQIVVAGERGDEVRHAACAVLALGKLDVNRVVKRLLDVPKASFAPSDQAVELTGMAYGGITPIGLAAGRPVSSTPACLKPRGRRGRGRLWAKTFRLGRTLAVLANVNVVEGLAVEGLAADVG